MASQKKTYMFYFYEKGQIIKKILKQSIDIKSLTANETKKILSHNDRIKFRLSKESTPDGIKQSKLGRNISLVDSINFEKYYKDMLAKYKIKGGMQAKTTVTSSFVISAGNIESHLSVEESIDYFEDVLKEIESRWKVLSFQIHFDEGGAPHAHCIISNLVEIDDRNAYWSSKSAFGWQGLSKSEVSTAMSQLRQDFWKKVCSKHGFEKPTVGGAKGFAHQLDYMAIKSQERILEAINLNATHVDESKLQIDEKNDLNSMVDEFQQMLASHNSRKRIPLKELDELYHESVRIASKFEKSYYNKELELSKVRGR